MAGVGGGGGGETEGVSNMGRFRMYFMGFY